MWWSAVQQSGNPNPYPTDRYTGSQQVAIQTSASPVGRGPWLSLISSGGNIGDGISGALLSAANSNPQLGRASQGRERAGLSN